MPDAKIEDGASSAATSAAPPAKLPPGATAADLRAAGPARLADCASEADVGEYFKSSPVARAAFHADLEYCLAIWGELRASLAKTRPDLYPAPPSMAPAKE